MKLTFIQTLLFKFSFPLKTEIDQHRALLMVIKFPKYTNQHMYRDEFGQFENLRP